MTPTLRDKLLIAMPGLKERAKTLIELFEASRFLWADRPLEINAAAQVLLTPEAKAVVAALLPEVGKAWPTGTRPGSKPWYAACRPHRRQTGCGRATVARGPDWENDFAADLRRAGGARPDRAAWRGSETRRFCPPSSRRILSQTLRRHPWQASVMLI